MQLRENEILIKIIRRHASSLNGSFSLAGGVLIIYLFVVYYFQFNFFGYVWQVLGVLILVLTMFVLYKIHIWNKNTLAITNQRLIYHEQNGFFSRTVTEVLYRDIHEITFKQKGFSASMSNFGTLIIRTPSDSEMLMEKISDPEKVVELINKTRGSLIHHHEQDTQF